MLLCSTLFGGVSPPTRNLYGLRPYSLDVDSLGATEDFVVGFDMDMTLLDTRASVKRAWQEMSALTGIPVDIDRIISRIGIPLEQEAAHWVNQQQVAEVVDTYRRAYRETAVDMATPLPGVPEALAAVHAEGGTSMVVTAKNEAAARLHVEHSELDVDAVVGGLFGSDKGAALRAQHASVYVGDHVHDIAGARAAGATAVAVATGPCSAAELQEAGADVVLSDLTGFADWLAEHVLQRRLAALAQRLREIGSLVVAFSGGVDSAFLLAAAVRTLGPDNVVAATAMSDSLAQGERDPAREFCSALGVRHITPTTHEMERAGYRANAGDRCYFCKAELLEVVSPMAERLGMAAVATGTNADDAVAGFRPGIRAAAERGAVTPLRDAGLRKSQIRAASRQWGLPTWDKPAAACLSSRIAYGIEVSPARLARVDRAEAAIRALLAEHGVAVGDLRVRDLGDQARVELGAPSLQTVLGDPQLVDAVVGSVTETGFATAYVDPKGFRSGSMNELLAEPARYR